MLTDLAEHVLDAMREVTNQSTPDGVGGALERVDRPEQRRDLGVGRAIVLQRDERLGHRLEMLDRLRDEVLENVRLVDEEAVQLGEPPRRLRVRLGRRRRHDAIERLGDRLPILDTGHADHVERRLEREHHVGQRREGTLILGRRSRRPLDRLLHRRGERRHLREAAERRRAAQPMRHHDQVLDRRRHARRAPQRGETVLDGGEGVPRLHQEDAQQELPIAVSHAGSPVDRHLRWPA